MLEKKLFPPQTAVGVFPVLPEKHRIGIRTLDPSVAHHARNDKVICLLLRQIAAEQMPEGMGIDDRQLRPV